MKLCLTLLFSAFLAGFIQGQENWPRFRGVDGRGVSEAKLPEEIGKQNLRWSVPLPGPGSSSPVIWGDSLFVTGEDRKKGKVTLTCLDAMSGKKRWAKSLNVGEYHLHRFNNTAAASPAVNEDIVVVCWYSAKKESAMMSAYDHKGNSLWIHEIGSGKSQHGLNIHPEIHGDKILVCHLHMNVGYVGAVGAKDGKSIWKTEFPGGKTSYVTPLVRKLPDGGKEVVVASQSVGVVGLDLKDGRVRWEVSGSMKQRTIVSPINVLAGSNSKDVQIAVGCKSGVYFTVRPPAKAGGEAQIVWRMKGNTPYVPTPVSDGKMFYSVSDGGMLVALDASSGEKKWEEKLMANFYASPLIVGGRLICLSREGELIVGEIGAFYKEISRTNLKLGEGVEWADVTPAVAHDRLYVRIGARLDCFGEK